MPAYHATYEVDGGVCEGFALKLPDHWEENRTLQANTSQQAFDEAMNLAHVIAMESFSNPDTGKTVVTLRSLRSPEGNVEYDRSKAAAERTMLEHVLHFAVER